MENVNPTKEPSEQGLPVGKRFLARRMVAGAADLVCIGLLLIIIAGTVALLFDTVQGQWAERLVPFLVALSTLYFWSALVARRPSPGEILGRIRVTNSQGRRPSVGVFLVRTVCLVVGLAAGGLGLWVAALSRSRRCVHDLIAGTFVLDMQANAFVRGKTGY